MKDMMEKAGYVVLGIMAGVILRGMYDAEVKRLRALAVPSKPKGAAAVAAVRG